MTQVYAAGYGVGDENGPVFGYQLGHALVVGYGGVYGAVFASRYSAIARCSDRGGVIIG